MSFSGKKYKIVSSENINKLNLSSSDYAQTYLRPDASFIFTREDKDTFSYSLHSEDRSLTSSAFKLGESHEMERRDGSKVQVVFHLLDDHVLSEVITEASGRTSNFKREFNGKRCLLTITTSDSDIQAKVFYEAEEVTIDAAEPPSKELTVRFWSTSRLWSIFRGRHSHTHTHKKPPVTQHN